MEWLRSLVRPTVTWLMGGVFAYGVVYGHIPWEAAVPVIVTVLVFWFEKREKQKAKE